jgi:hypothetical protein
VVSSCTLAGVREKHKETRFCPRSADIYYFNDNWQILCDYNDANDEQRWFAYSNYIDEVVLMSETCTLLGSARYYIQDHLYRPAALMGSTGPTPVRFPIFKTDRASTIPPGMIMLNRCFLFVVGAVVRIGQSKFLQVREVEWCEKSHPT